MKRLDQRRHSILEYETAVARGIAAAIVEKPALSAWMILIPLLFLHYVQRQQAFKRGVDGVSEELLRSRRRALECACNDVTNGTRDERRVCLHGEACDNELCQLQAAEIALLARHYRKLLVADGDDFPALARDAYGNPGAYRQMLGELECAERAVTAAASQRQREIEGRTELFTNLDRARADAHAGELKVLFG